jgi:hypothetical protein
MGIWFFLLILRKRLGLKEETRVCVVWGSKRHVPQDRDRDRDIHCSGNPTFSRSVSNFKATICKHLPSSVSKCCLNVGRKAVIMFVQLK